VKQRWNKLQTRRVIGGMIIAVAACVTYFLLQNLGALKDNLDRLGKVLEPFTIGLALAFLINLPMVFIENRLVRLNQKQKKPFRQSAIRAISLTASVLLLLMTVSLFVATIAPQLGASMGTFMGNIDGYLTELNEWLSKTAVRFHLDPKIVDDLLPSFDQFINIVIDFFSKSFMDVVSTASQVGTTLLNAVIGLIISVYFLSAKETFFGQWKKILYALMKPEKVDRLIRIGFLANRTFTGFVSGKLVDSLIIGILCFVGLMAMKMPYALLISVIIGITNIVPFFGPIIGAVPSTLIVLLVDPLKALLLLIFIVVLQQFDGNILGPRILGDSTGLPTLWVMFAILVGSGLFGFAGMLISVPTFAVIYALLKEAINSRLTSRGLTVDPQYYRRPGSLRMNTAATEPAADTPAEENSKTPS